MLSAIIVVFVLLAVVLLIVLIMVLFRKKSKLSLRAQCASQMSGSREILLCDDVDQGHVRDVELQATSVEAESTTTHLEHMMTAHDGVCRSTCM